MRTKYTKLIGLIVGLLLPYVAWSATYDVVKIQNKRTPSHYIVANNGGAHHLEDTGDGMSQWIIHNVQGGVTIQNVGTGLFISALQRDKATSLSSEAAVFTLAKDGNYTTLQNGDLWANASGGNSNLIGWAPIDDGSRWTIVPAGTLTSEEWADRIDQANGVAAPAAGMYCRLFAPAYSAYMTEDYGSMTLNCQPYISDSPYRQLWQLSNAGNGKYRLQNVYTGHYVMAVKGASQPVITTEKKIQAGTFTVTRSTKSDIIRYYSLGSGGQYNNLHCDASKNVVGWEAGSWGNINGSEWQFAPVEITEEEVAAARAEFNEKTGLLANVDQYQAVLDQLFLDKACTQLNPSADFDALTAQLPDVLKGMATKIRDNSWQVYKSGRNWEQTFRIADYHVYSKHNGMSGIVGMSNAFGRLTNPTGIMCQAGSVMAIMVDGDVPQGATLAIEAYSADSQGATGNQFALKKGLNFVAIDKWSTFFIFYEINGTDDAPSCYLASFPDMKIHIEGGEVCGYWDQTRGMTDADWQAMMADGLFTFNRTQMKADHVMMNMSTTHVKNKIPKYIERLIAIWNNIVIWENDMLGINDDWIPNISKRFNCLLNATSIDHNYMYATTYGTYYNETTLNEILDYNNMLTSGGNIWGPAHEFGHNHQNLFNMAGMTEVSNNVFSNMVVFKQGATTSRGEAMDVIPGLYAKGTPWIDYGIWAQTQLYWKLYQYFHLAGHDTLFYQKVFDIMRRDPLRRRANVQLNADVDYLHFAEVCCQAANADLSELFESYGMFRLMEEQDHQVGGGIIHGRHVDDYGNYYLHVTQAMIDAAKKKMQSYPKKIKNIIFIDDRVRKSPAIYEGAPEGTMRKPFSNETYIGQMGDLRCQWSDYDAENPIYADGYTYNLAGSIFQSKGGKNAAGFKFYDKDGNLIYFTSFSKVTLPQDVLKAFNDNGYVVAAQVDGTDVELTRSGKYAYIVKTYRGSEQEVATSYVNGRVAPSLQPNWIAVVEANGDNELADYSFAGNANVMTGGQLSVLNVTDNEPIYIPADGENKVTAKTATFTRTEALGWSTLCLPFDYKVSDFGSDVTVYIPTNFNEKTFECAIRQLEPEEVVPAGIPVIINSTNSIVQLNLSDVQRVTSEQPVGEWNFNGNFDLEFEGGWDSYGPDETTMGNHHMGAFDINPDGTVFDQTSIRPMHAIANCPFRITGAVDGITVVNNDLDPEAMYNLSGIRIVEPRRGEPYIKGGRIYLTK